MTRKRSKRKVRPIDFLSVYRLTGRNSQFTPDEQAEVMVTTRKSFQAFIDRTAVRQDYDQLATAVSVAMVAAERIDVQVVDVCVPGVAAIGRAYERHIKTGQWGLDGPAKAEIADALDIYEQMMALMTGGQMHNAMVEVMQRQADGNVIEVGA
ncbi:MAG: hypothetical protein H7172_00330 [Ferruginibacter sp.]|nr:hypothetical protein [Rhodoferax sp.]